MALWGQTLHLRAWKYHCHENGISGNTVIGFATRPVVTSSLYIARTATCTGNEEALHYQCLSPARYFHIGIRLLCIQVLVKCPLQVRVHVLNL